MKTQNTYISKIATLVYAQYTENVDMNLAWFKQSEVDELFKNDKSILRVDYYENGVLVNTDKREVVVAAPVVKKEKTYTPKQAAAQIMKMNTSIAKLYERYEDECGSRWFEIRQKNETTTKMIGELEEKQEFYKPFLNEEVFWDTMASDLCISWEDYSWGIEFKNV